MKYISEFIINHKEILNLIFLITSILSAILAVVSENTIDKRSTRFIPLTKQGWILAGIIIFSSLMQYMVNYADNKKAELQQEESNTMLQNNFQAQLNKLESLTAGLEVFDKTLKQEAILESERFDKNINNVFQVSDKISTLYADFKRESSINNKNFKRNIEKQNIILNKQNNLNRLLEPFTPFAINFQLVFSLNEMDSTSFYYSIIKDIADTLIYDIEQMNFKKQNSYVVGISKPSTPTARSEATYYIHDKYQHIDDFAILDDLYVGLDFKLLTEEQKLLVDTTKFAVAHLKMPDFIGDYSAASQVMDLNRPIKSTLYDNDTNLSDNVEFKTLTSITFYPELKQFTLSYHYKLNRASDNGAMKGISDVLQSVLKLDIDNVPGGSRVNFIEFLFPPDYSQPFLMFPVFQDYRSRKIPGYKETDNPVFYNLTVVSLVNDKSMGTLKIELE